MTLRHFLPTLTIVALNNTHSWQDGASGITSAVWSGGGTILTVTLSTGVSDPDVAVGDTITLDGLTITDVQPNNSTAIAYSAITGDWGQLAVQVSEGDAIIIRNNLINPDRGEYAVITFNLNKSTKVNITVYDLAGKPVDVLYNRTASAGFNHVRW